MDLNSKKLSERVQIFGRYGKGRFTELHSCGGRGLRENLLIFTLSVCLELLTYVTQFVYQVSSVKISTVELYYTLLLFNN